jgi:aqualysin 1
MRNSRLQVGLLLGITLGVSACTDDSTAPTPLVADDPALAAAPGQGGVLRPARERGIPDQYVVVFRESVRDVPGLASGLLQAHGGTRIHLYQHAIKGFAARLPPQAVAALQRNPNIASIEQDFVFTIRGHTVQESAPWGLDRIDQRDLPLGGTYTYTSDGAGVNIYIVDTGIRLTHDDFGGRASLGVDYIGDGLNGGDCEGHGTHVAGNAGGATWGVAKGANLISVRVADCAAQGYFSNAVAAVDWITANAVAPAVANLSFGWAVSGAPTAVEIAVENSIAAGVFYAGATANARIEACEDFPSRIAALMTVARTDINDRMVANTGFGPCIDLFAPGQAIPSAAIGSDNATRTRNGTSYATPHVAGVAALHRQQNPAWTPAQVMARILADATTGRIGTDTNGAALPDGTPDRLLFSPIQNAAPVAVTGGPYGGSEGSPVAFDASGSSDADGDALTFSWTFGDGGTATGPTPSHTYVDNGAYTVTLSVADGLVTTVATTTATIVNVAPTVNAGPDAEVLSGQTFAFSGSFSDPGVIDHPWSWVIDWGFGPTTTGSTNSQSTPITASRQVCAAGSYNVVLSVTDKDGGTGSDALTLTVPYRAVVIDIMPTDATNPVNVGNRGLLPVAILSTPTFDARQVDPATVVLGDESGSDTPVARQNNGRYHAKLEDVNGDRRLDLVLMFEVPALVGNGDLTASSTQLVLRGFLNDGCTNVRGADAVRIVP